MSNERTENCSLLNFHIAIVNCVWFQTPDGAWHIDLSKLSQVKDIQYHWGNFTGALNSKYREQYPNTPLPPVPMNGTPQPPDPPADPLADIRVRQSTGSSFATFAAKFFTPEESNALKAMYPQDALTISQINNFYGPGGFGNINGQREGNLFFYDDHISGAKHVPDVDGAADLFIVNQPGNPNHVAPPAYTIPPA